MNGTGNHNENTLFSRSVNFDSESHTIRIRHLILSLNGAKYLPIVLCYIKTSTLQCLSCLWMVTSGSERRRDDPVEMTSTEQLKVTKRFSFAGLTNWSDSSPKVESVNLDKVRYKLRVVSQQVTGLECCATIVICRPAAGNCSVVETDQMIDRSRALALKCTFNGTIFKTFSTLPSSLRQLICRRRRPPN